MSRLGSWIAFCVLAIGSPALAERALCDITKISNALDPRIGDQIVVEFDRGTGRARVYDGFPKPEDMPHLGKIGRETDKVLSFVWSQPGMAYRRNTNLVMAFAYRLSVRRSSGLGILTATTTMRDMPPLSAQARCVIG